ncbi:MAG: holo-ACP synthase [Pseudomonadota bacterium]
MIIAIGSDLLDIRRIEKTMARFGPRFIERCFTKDEQAWAENRREAGTHINTYAKRFAAKEAVSKALGTGIDKDVYLKDIGVVNTQEGKPNIELTNGALKRLKDMTPPKHEAHIHLTLTDEPPLASAHVIIEARPVMV